MLRDQLVERVAAGLEPEIGGRDGRRAARVHARRCPCSRRPSFRAAYASSRKLASRPRSTTTVRRVAWPSPSKGRLPSPPTRRPSSITRDRGGGDALAQPPAPGRTRAGRPRRPTDSRPGSRARRARPAPRRSPAPAGRHRSRSELGERALRGAPADALGGVERRERARRTHPPVGLHRAVLGRDGRGEERVVSALVAAREAPRSRRRQRRRSSSPRCVPSEFTMRGSTARAARSASRAAAMRASSGASRSAGSKSASSGRSAAKPLARQTGIRILRGRARERHRVARRAARARPARGRSSRPGPCGGRATRARRRAARACARAPASRTRSPRRARAPRRCARRPGARPRRRRPRGCAAATAWLTSSASITARCLPP